MKLLRETIRKLILESNSDSAANFFDTLQSEFDYLRENKYGTSIFGTTFPDDCRVEFGIAITENQEVHIDYIETIGDDCFQKGYASRVMKHILFLLDSFNLSAVLEVESFGSGGMDDNDLSQWYKSMGFKHEKDFYQQMGFVGLRRYPSP